MSFNSSGLSSPGGPGGQNAVDPEMQAFIEAEGAKAKIQQQIHKLNNLCWDTCVDKPRDKLDSRTESCMCNCVERYVDVAKVIEQRFQQRIQKAASGF